MTTKKSPLHLLRRQVRDWLVMSLFDQTLLPLRARKLEQRFPGFRCYADATRSIRAELKPVHEVYVREVSSPAMAVSLETSVLLRFLLDVSEPRKILDLGSGFSSFVFRSYAASHDGCQAWSVDDHPDWLKRTGEFLESRQLPVERLMPWPDFERERGGEFDFIFHDLGSMELRQRSLPVALSHAANGRGVVVLDDMHKRRYARAVRQTLGACACRHFNLRTWTADALGRFCWLVCDIRNAAGRGSGWLSSTVAPDDAKPVNRA